LPGHSPIDHLLLLQHLVELSAIHLLLELLIPSPLLNLLDILVQTLVSALIFAYFDDSMLPVPCIQLVDQLRDQMRVVEGLLYGGQMRAWSLAFPRIRLTIGLNSITIGPT
jgi:hypothetical protein